MTSRRWRITRTEDHEMRKILAALALSLVVRSAPAMGTNDLVVVRLTDFDKTITYELMTVGEHKALEKELREEARLGPKALAAAQQEWSKDEARKTAFPRSAVSPRRADVMGRPFGELEEAEEKLADYEDRLGKKEADEADERKREKSREYYQKKKMSKGQLRKFERTKARDLARAKIPVDARELFKAKLAALKGGSGDGKEGEANKTPGETAPEDK